MKEKKGHKLWTLYQSRWKSEFYSMEIKNKFRKEYKHSEQITHLSLK